MSQSFSDSGVRMVLWLDSPAHGYQEYAVALPGSPSALCLVPDATAAGFAPSANVNPLLRDAPTLMATLALKVTAIDRCYPYLFKRRLLGVTAAQQHRVLYFEGVTIAVNEALVPTHVLVTERPAELAYETSEFFCAVREGRFGALDTIFTR